MATIFTFPKEARVGDRLEIVSISQEKMPITIVGNEEAGKNLCLIFPNEILEGASDGVTAIATIEYTNILYSFRCVSVKDKHVWLLENFNEESKKNKHEIDVYKVEIENLKLRIEMLENAGNE